MLAGCGGPKADLTINPANFSQPDPIPVRTASSQYRIGALDRFQMTVFRAPDLSGEYIVEPSGLVQFPLIGEVQVAGRTSTELAALLSRLYSQRYLRDPNIAVKMLQTTTQLVTVGGSVNSPINFELIGETQLLQAVTRAGGTNASANRRRVVVLRKIDGVQQAAGFDLARIEEGLDPNPTIYPGDVVVVDGSQLRQALRDVLTAIPLVGLFTRVF
ncbi:polysaccharide biosynthesis/export family protein [Novosphingopyxis sp.]|uniref:polysaccharide biosynthesis/export family protein n=1 Tax=Novosphingopyxis sp. TaxID=2709690 RepID=UPI003B594401